MSGSSREESVDFPPCNCSHWHWDLQTCVSPLLSAGNEKCAIRLCERGRCVPRDVLTAARPWWPFQWYQSDCRLDVSFRGGFKSCLACGVVCHASHYCQAWEGGFSEQDLRWLSAVASHVTWATRWEVTPCSVEKLMFFFSESEMGLPWFCLALPFPASAVGSVGAWTPNPYSCTGTCSLRAPAVLLKQHWFWYENDFVGKETGVTSIILYPMSHNVKRGMILLSRYWGTNEHEEQPVGTSVLPWPQVHPGAKLLLFGLNGEVLSFSL